MGRAQDDDLALDGDPFDQALASRPAMPAEGADAPKIIVRRKRQLERPVDAPPEEASGDAESRRPRVFVLPRTDEADASEGAVDHEAAGGPPIAAGAATPASPVVPEPLPAAAPTRRRSTPEFRRAGPVTIARPVVERPHDASQADAGPPPSLAQLMAQFDELTERLATMHSGPFRLELDLTINTRWAAIDRALEALRESLPSTKWEPTF